MQRRISSPRGFETDKPCHNQGASCYFPSAGAALMLGAAATAGAVGLGAWLWRLRRHSPAPIGRRASPIPASTREATSFSNFHDCIVHHLNIDLIADFERSVLRGSVELTAQVQRTGCRELVLDSRGLLIKAAFVNGVPTTFMFGARTEALGQALHVALGSGREFGSDVIVRLEYETAAGDACTAAQWLPPQQTAGKIHPYLFTQCQAVHCRSLLPCQDAPCVKATYTAAITVPSPLVALMSAVSTGSTPVEGGGATRYTFVQRVPMPAYLIALASGELESREIGPRSRVWSEPSVVDAGAAEFADTERFLSAAEEVCGPYVWGRYDLLVLPPSFPYGGMENPCLTFVTPTLLAGDRSLANVVAHEVAHSWMGNLVTNATWSDFWLNEGFTVFVERKIIARLFGKPVADLKAAFGRRHLKDAVQQFGETHAFTALHIEMDAESDPDDSFSSIPYEKGSNFLRYLEGLVGEDFFADFIRAHVARFQYSTVSVAELRATFEAFFTAADHRVDPAVLRSVDWDKWVNAPGMPPVLPDLDTSRIELASAASGAWLDGLRHQEGYENAAAAQQAMGESWSSDLTALLLENLLEEQELGAGEEGENGGPSSKCPPELADAAAADLLRDPTTSRGLFDALDLHFGLTVSRNAEIRFSWLTLRLRARDERAHAHAVALLLEQGRMKFTRPLYRDLARSSPSGRKLAIATFKTHRAQYHAICQKMVARDLGLEDE